MSGMPWIPNFGSARGQPLVLGGKCYNCPENHPAALQFHHRDPSTKSFVITTKQLASPKKYPWEVILAEIEKCDLLCANCHFKLHCVWELPGEESSE